MTYIELRNLIGSSEAADLISHFCGKSPEWILLHRDTTLPTSIDAAVSKILEGTPLQYITGKAYFYGDRYFITPDVLIPQPDTEHIVEAALNHIKPGCKLLDLCTGSGCIAISILKRTLASCTAVDISSAALQVAKKNAELHKVLSRLNLVTMNVLTEDLSSLIASSDVITANPPYINSDEINSLPKAVQNEPRIALDGGNDGMKFYQHFLEYAPYLKKDAVMIFEIGYDQAERIAMLAEAHDLTCEIKKDFGGNDRVAILKHKLN